MQTITDTILDATCAKQFRALRGSPWSNIAGHLLIAEARESRLPVVSEVTNRQDMLTRFAANDMRREWAIQSRQPSWHEARPSIGWMPAKGAFSDKRVGTLQTLQQRAAWDASITRSDAMGSPMGRRARGTRRSGDRRDAQSYAELRSAADRYSNK